MVYFTQKSKFSKFHGFYAENESKIKNHLMHRFVTKRKLQDKIILRLDF